MLTINTKRVRVWTVAILLSTVGLAMQGCDPLGLKPVARSIEDLASSMNNGTEGVERVRVTVENAPGELEKILSQATAEQKEIIRNTQSELRNMLSQTMQQGSVVAPFTFDYVREQVVFDLRTLAAKIGNKPLPIPITRIALPKATTLDRRDIGTAVTLDWVVTGANLNAPGVRVIARTKSGVEIPLVTSMQTPYMLVVPFNEQNRARLAEWAAIEVLTSNTREKVSVAVMEPVVHPDVVVKKPDTKQVRPDALTFWPEYHSPMIEVNVPKSVGTKFVMAGIGPKPKVITKPAYDNEFKGHGPTTTVSAEFRVNPKNDREIQGKFAVQMYESNSKNGRDGDKTRGSYASDWVTVQTLGVGQSVRSDMPRKQEWTFRDANGTDLFTETVTHPFIQSFTVMGDTKTDQDMATAQGDASKSHIKVNFKTFSIDYEYEVKTASRTP